LHEIPLKIAGIMEKKIVKKAAVKTGSDQGSRHPQKWLGSAWPLLWFALAGFLLFGQTLRFDYTWLDDQTLVLNNLENLKSAANIPSAFTGDVFHSLPGNRYYYRPVLTLSFMADAGIGGGSFTAFHAGNILYHVIAVFLVFLLFAELGFDRLRSFLFSMLFLVHPLVTQVVAWVPGRNDSLLAIFSAGSFLFFIRYLKTGRQLTLWLSFFFYVLALFTKENAIVIPFLFAAYAFLVSRVPWKKMFLPVLSWILLTTAWAVIRHQALGAQGGASLFVQVLSVMRGLPALLPFLGKAVFPFDLSVFPILADMKVSLVLGMGVLVLLGVLFRFTAPADRALSAIGLAWFLAFLVPSFVSVSGQIPNYSEHRSYLSLAGILLMVLASAPVKKASFSSVPPLVVMAGTILLFGLLTFRHAGNFRDRLTFWKNAVETSPSHAFNYNNLGAMYFLDHEFEKAEPYFLKAIEINPYEPMAHSNAGLICMNTGRPAEAEKFYLEEIRINPKYDHAYFNLGILYYNSGKYDEGIRLWEKTLEINPGYKDAYDALLFAFQKLDRPGDRDRILKKATENRITH